MIKFFEKNTLGRDFVIGDIHGHFSAVSAELEKIGFDKTKDRLFSVGDLVDRGPESHHVLDWISQPWFHAVQGNHEDMAIRFVKNGKNENEIAGYIYNGGSWFVALSDQDKCNYSESLSKLPYAMQIETDAGSVGVVHAEVPAGDWHFFSDALQSGSINRILRNSALWDRVKINGDTSNVTGIDFVYVGHTPLDNPVKLGNVNYIDTAGWHKSGRFTIVQIQ